MAWTHFTSYLAEGELLTKAQRDELYDAFEERAASVSVWTGATYTAPSAVRDCGLSTDLLERSAGSSPLRLEAAINAIAPRFGKASVLTAASFTGTIAYAAGQSGPGGIFYDAAGVCGIPTADVTEILASGLDERRRWNLYRAALTLLQHPELGSPASRFVKSASESYDGTDLDPGVADTAWATVKSELVAASEAPAASSAGAYLLRQHTGSSTKTYTLQAQRIVYSVTIPAMPAFSGHSSIYVAVQNNDSVALTLTWQGTPAAISAPIFPTLKYQLFSGSGATGAADADLRFDHYDSGSGLDALRPDPAPFNDQFFGVTTSAIYGAPVWGAG